MQSKKSIYNKSMRILEQRRERSAFEAQSNYLEACDKEPEIANIQKKLSKTSIEISRAILSGQGDPQVLLEKIRRENLKQQNELKRLLKQNNFPENFLEQKPQCPKCDDYGYVNLKKCQCLQEIIVRLAADDLQSSTNLKLSDFNDFNLNYYSKGPDESGVSAYDHMSRVFQFCKKYAAQFTPGFDGILMTGKTGLGKTHLSLAIADKVISTGYSVIYLTVSDFVRKASAQYFNKEKYQSQDDIMDIVSQIDLLLMDDLGAEFESSFSKSAIYDMLNSRLNAGRPTIISTNLTAPELQNRYSERIVSRLFTQLTPLHFIGQDIRMIRSK